MHEAGFDSADDCRAIWRVLDRGARRHRTTPLAFARRYSRTVFDTTRTDPCGETHNTFYARPLRGRRGARAVQITP